MNPSIIAGYAFKLAQVYNSFYTVHKIANAESEAKKVLRTAISAMAAQVIEKSMSLLGIAVPPRM